MLGGSWEGREEEETVKTAMQASKQASKQEGSFGRLVDDWWMDGCLCFAPALTRVAGPVRSVPMLAGGPCRERVGRCFDRIG